LASETFTGYTGSPIDAPAALTASQGTYSDRIVLSWNAVERATSYNVFVADDSAGPYTLLGNVSSPGANHTSVAVSTTHYYKVIATDGNSGGAESEIISGFTGIALSVPEDLSASQGLYSDKIALSWAEVPGATEYNIYYSSTSTGTYTLLGTTPSRGVNHTSILADTTYYYKVSATDRITVGEVSQIFLGYTGSALSAPALVDASEGTYPDKILISWSAVTGATSYKVYYSTTPSGEFNLLGSTVGTTATHESVPSGTTYYYVITASSDVEVSVPTAVQPGSTSE